MTDECFEYNDFKCAIEDLAAGFPVPEQHYKNNQSLHSKNEVQKRLEFYVLIKFLESVQPKYPIKIEYCGEKEGYPDFVCSFGNEQFLIEITRITDQKTQENYQSKKQYAGEESGSLDLTTLVSCAVDRKNKKIENYKKATAIVKSVLLVHYDSIDALCFDPVCDDWDPEKISSQFDCVFVFISIHNSFTDERGSFLKLGDLDGISSGCNSILG